MSLEAKIEALTQAVVALTANVEALTQAVVAFTAKLESANVAAPAPVAQAPAPVVAPVPLVQPVATVPAPVATTAPVMPPAPAFTAPQTAPVSAGAPFTDGKGLIDYVMGAYKALGPQKGAQIQNVLVGLGYQNINDVKPEHYGALFAGVEQLKAA